MLVYVAPGPTVSTCGVNTTAGGIHMPRHIQPAGRAMARPSRNSTNPERQNGVYFLHGFHTRRGEVLTFHYQHGDVVLAARAIGRRDQFGHRSIGIARIALHRVADFLGTYLVAQAVAAKQ